MAVLRGAADCRVDVPLRHLGYHHLACLADRNQDLELRFCMGVQTITSSSKAYSVGFGRIRDEGRG